MEYRVHRKTGDKISVLGIGTSYISEAPEKEALETLAYAFENGINYADLGDSGSQNLRLFRKGIRVREIQDTLIRYTSGQL